RASEELPAYEPWKRAGVLKPNEQLKDDEAEEDVGEAKSGVAAIHSRRREECASPPLCWPHNATSTSPARSSTWITRSSTAAFGRSYSQTCASIHTGRSPASNEGSTSEGTLLPTLS